jgi:uncharacterized membrane protein
MSELKKLSLFIFGLIFIILGFLTFSYIEYVNQRPAVASSNILYYVIVAGFVFLAIGIIFMIIFTKKDLKKKKKNKSTQSSLTCYFCGKSGNNKTIKKFPKSSPEYGGKYCCFNCYNKYRKK